MTFLKTVITIPTEFYDRYVWGKLYFQWEITSDNFIPNEIVIIYYHGSDYLYFFMEFSS